MEVYTPNATEQDIAFVETVNELQAAGIEVKPLPGNKARFNSEAVVYFVADNGEIVRCDEQGSFYVGRI